MKELIEKLAGFQNILDQKDLTIENLDEFVETSKEVYERAIILRYKLYEQNILIEKPHVVNVSEIEDTKPEIETPEIDFSLFNTTQEEAAPNSIDSFNKNDYIEEYDNEATFKVDSFENSMQPSSNELIQEVVPFTQEIVEETIVHESITNEEKIIHHEEIIEKKPDEETHYSYEKTTIKEEIPNFQSHLGLGKLDTLIGSFGLNERLQYINELFDGSSEAFSDGIKLLDNQKDYQSAREILVEFSKTFQWDKESDTVVEFAQKVARRYA